MILNHYTFSFVLEFLSNQRTLMTIVFLEVTAPTASNEFVKIQTLEKLYVMHKFRLYSITDKPLLIANPGLRILVAMTATIFRWLSRMIASVA